MVKSLISLGEVCNRVSLSRTSVYDLIKSGEFPSQVRVSANRVAWVSEEIEEWIEDRISTSRNTKPAESDRGLISEGAQNV